MLLLARMSETPTPVADAGESTRELLAGAARASIDAEITVEAFMRAAYAAYMDSRPGLQEYLEDRAVRAQIAELRQRGQVALA